MLTMLIIARIMLTILNSPDGMNNCTTILIIADYADQQSVTTLTMLIWNENSFIAIANGSKKQNWIFQLVRERATVRFIIAHQ